MQCLQCKADNPPEAVRCQSCQAPLDPGDETITDAPASAPDDATLDGSSWTGVQEAAAAAAPSSGLQVGSILGKRYEILKMLGEGGMGAVYKARDRELDRLVAVKVIQPELARQKEVLQRFKQELILARQVTHKNVIRIFDLGEADGVKFITMEYIDGQDLKSVLREKGKLTAKEASKIMRQVCRALNAAHEEGVVHRDLKPQNIMLDKKENVSVMDFGIARSMEKTGMTMTGALLGTPQYMSPEQAKGEPADARSDLFSLGIIFYELVTGEVPFHAETPLATLLKRTQETPPPPAEVDKSVPSYISEIILKCLQIDREQRYQGALEILEDLEARTASRTTARLLLPFARKWRMNRRRMIDTAVAVLFIILAGMVIRENFFSGAGRQPELAPEPVTLAIVPFHNASGDPSLDWLGPGLADMLTTDVGQSAGLQTVSSNRLHQILTDLRISSVSTMDPNTLRRLAEFSNAEIIIGGQYAKFGEQIRIDATLHDLKQDKTIPLKVEAASQNDLLSAVDQLAQSIQQNLELSGDLLEELRATAFRPSSESLRALRYYNEGLQLTREGKHLEAVKKFESSVEEDPEFALAHARLAQTYNSLGYDSEAEQASYRAIDLEEKITPQEKYLVAAGHAQILNDHEKAIEAYEKLAELFPNNLDVRFDLGRAYENAGSFEQGREQYAKVIERDPKHLDGLFAMGRIEIKAGKPQNSLDHLNRALSLAIQLGNEEAKGTMLNAIGIAYHQMNKLQEALQNYREALALRRQIGHEAGTAETLRRTAQVQTDLGNPDEARANYTEALELRRKIGDKAGIATALMDFGTLYNSLGQYGEAMDRFKEALRIQRELGDEFGEAKSLNNIGAAHFNQGQYGDALTYFERALPLREKFGVAFEIAETLHNLAETSTRMGNFDDALARYLRALELSRDADDQLGVAIESYSMGTVFARQGRYGAALESKQEAIDVVRELQESGFWLAEILGSHSQALSQVGRYQEAQENLSAALEIARELDNKTLIAQILNFQGENQLYRGDFASAGGLFGQALQVATEAADRHQILVAGINQAKANIIAGQRQAPLASLEKLNRDSGRLGLKYRSAESATYLGEAMLDAGDQGRARRVLEAARLQSEKLGSRHLLARSHCLLGKAQRQAGNEARSQRHYQQALALLEEMQKESGRDDLLKRADLAPLYEESSQSAKQPASLP